MADKYTGGIKAGSTSVSHVVHLTKAGAAVTALVAADLTMYYYRVGAAATTVQALSNLAAINSAFAAGGLKELDATNMPGDYRLDIPDAALAAGVDWAEINLKPAAAKTDDFSERIALSTDLATAAWGLTDGIEVGMTPKNALRDILAILLGELAGGATATPTFKSVDLSAGIVQSTKTRVTGASVDQYGNRGKPTLDHS